MNSEKHCGVISKFYFTVNNLTYFESQYHNTCLNRKISIDINGEIKNCPSMKESFGNINDISLKTVLGKEEFKKYWNITKSQIDICKECEFRAICTDCRAYVEEPNSMYSKPLKCGYDPYSMEWTEWSRNPLKSTAIAYYGMTNSI